MAPVPSDPSPSQSLRLSTTGIVLITVSGALFILVALALCAVYRRRRTCSSAQKESSWRSIWVLSRPRRKSFSATSSRRGGDDNHKGKHIQNKLSTHTAGSVSLDFCRTTGPTVGRVPKQWFLQGSPQQEIEDPYSNSEQYDVISPLSIGKNGQLQSQQYFDDTLESPKPTLRSVREAHKLDATRMSFATTLVNSRAADINSLAPSTMYPYAPSTASCSQPNSPVYGFFPRQDAEHSQQKQVPNRHTFGYEEPRAISPSTLAGTSAAQQVQVRYHQDQQQQRGEEQPIDRTADVDDDGPWHLNPLSQQIRAPPRAAHPMIRQQSDAPSLALSVPRSVTPTSPMIEQDEETRRTLPDTTRQSPRRPGLVRDARGINNGPSIAISPPSPKRAGKHDIHSPSRPASLRVPASSPEHSYFSSRRGGPQAPPMIRNVSSESAVSITTANTSPSSTSSPAMCSPSPGLNSAFRSAFFLDIGPNRSAINLSSLPQTPAYEY